MTAPQLGIGTLAAAAATAGPCGGDNRQQLEEANTAHDGHDLLHGHLHPSGGSP